jgi:hypothetical protein
MANVNRIAKAGKDEAIVTALRDDVLKLDQLPLGSRMYTRNDLAALLKKRIAANLGIDQAKAAWKAAILAYKNLDREVEIVLRDLRNVVIGAYGEDSLVVKGLTFAPRKKPVLTSEQKKLAAERRNATRKKRRTMGRKQKLAIKGEVPAAAAEPATEVDPSNGSDRSGPKGGSGESGASG